MSRIGGVLHLVATMARRGLLRPGRPDRIAAQLWALRRYGFTFAGGYRSAAARSPHRIAVVDERGPVTYAALDAYATRLAHGLRTLTGLARPRVGILCGNHHGFVATVVAAAKLGGDTVLCNTSLSANQIRAVLAEARVDVLVADGDFAPAAAPGIPLVVAWPPDDPTVVVRDAPTLDSLADGVPATRLPPPAQPGATVILTSGTTGTPKGAYRPTPSGLSPLTAVLSRIPLRVYDRILIAAPLFHTWGYAGLQLAMALRATVVLRRRFAPASTVDALAAHRCDALIAVPVMCQRLLDASPTPPPSVAPRVVAVSGSALPGDLATRFMDAYGDVLYNLYGSTEVSWASIATPAELRRDPATSGRPPYGTRLAILDAAGGPVRRGTVGRVFVGNDMLSEGYTNGSRRETRAGLAATGDLGYLDAGGLLHLTGREDDMIVSGGENIHPATVTDALAALPEIAEAAVVGVPDQEFGQRLAAYVVVAPGATLDADTLRERIRDRVGRFAVPRDVHFVDSLPRNATGKVVPRLLRPPR